MITATLLLLRSGSRFFCITHCSLCFLCPEGCTASSFWLVSLLFWPHYFGPIAGPRFLRANGSAKPDEDALHDTQDNRRRILLALRGNQRLWRKRGRPLTIPPVPDWD